jgi:hypothetical protein
MSFENISQEPNQKKVATSFRARLHSPDEWLHMAQMQGVPRNFHNFQDGDPIALHLMGTRVDDFATQNGYIAGHFTSSKNAYMRVEYCEGVDDDINGREIGLGHDARMPLAMGKMIAAVTFIRSVAPYRDFIYYFPSELDPNDILQYPTLEQQHRTFSRYGKVVAGQGKTVLFDVLHNKQ